MIVTAFAEGDRRQLRSLLSREVFEGFDTVITERESRGETAETRFVSIDASTITGSELRGRTVQIIIRLVPTRLSVPRVRSRPVFDDNAKKFIYVTDVWTFARD